MYSNKFKKFVINYYGNLPKILEQLDIKVPPNGVFYCPMHDNYNTPAAKLFKDNTGYNFYCFAEHKIYSTYDIYKEIYNYDMNKIFLGIWDAISDTDKEMLNNLFGNDVEEVVTNIQDYIDFKNNKASYLDLINKLELYEK